MSTDYKNLKIAFEQLGLTENEAYVYFELLKAGQSAIVDISKRTGIARSSCYDIIDRLQRIGLISKITHANREEYVVEDLQKIDNLLNDQQKNSALAQNALRESLPHLLAISCKNSSKSIARYITGVDAVKLMLLQILDESLKSEVLNICQGYSDKEAELSRDPDYLKDYIRKEKELRIKARTLMEDMQSARDYKSEYETEFNQIILIPRMTSIKTEHIDKYIWNNKVCFFNHQKDYAILIEDQFIAENERTSFNILWRKLIER